MTSKVSAGFQVDDQVLTSFSGNFQREPVHGPRHVHDEGESGRGITMGVTLGLGHQEEIIFLLALVQEKAPPISAPRAGISR